MGRRGFRQKHTMPEVNSLQKKNLQKIAEELSADKRLRFDRGEIEQLLIMFTTLTSGNKKALIERTQFRDVLHDSFKMTEEILMDRVFRAFDEDMDGYISMKDWCQGLSTFLRGALEEKTVYTFKCFDLNGDGYISREEMFQLLKHCLVKQPAEEDPDEGIKELVEITLKKMDLDHDSRLSLADFTQSVKNEELLLEAFGKCLPDDDLIHQFEAEVLQTK